MHETAKEVYQASTAKVGVKRFIFFIFSSKVVGVPSVGSNIYGIVDAIENNQTGLLHEPSEVLDIKDRLKD